MSIQIGNGLPELGQKPEHREGCLVCGKELVYSEQSRNFQCMYCGQNATGTIYCPDGHFVCDACHRGGAVRQIEIMCSQSTETNPFRLAKAIMATPFVHMHGPEHHQLVPVVILTCLRNLGVPIKPHQVQNALIRAGQLPGGICGNWGACGAALGAGIGLSVLRRVTSLSKDLWGVSNRDTGTILQQVAAYGGPRCCKRSTYLALTAAIAILERDGAVQFPESAHIPPVCGDFRRNQQCLDLGCPFYPRARTSELQFK